MTMTRLGAGRACMAATVLSMMAGAGAEAASIPSPFLLQGGIADYWIDGTTTGAILDASVSAGQSGFSGNFAVEGNPRGSGSGTTSMSLVPFVNDKTYIELNFDSQQNSGGGGANVRLEISTIAVTIDGDLIWQLDGLASPIILNAATAAPTDSPTGNGRDFRLLIPTRYIAEAALLNNATYTGASVLGLTWTQANSTGSPDEWELTSCTAQGNFCFATTDVIADPEIIPLPAAAALLSTALAGLIWLRRRRAA